MHFNPLRLIGSGTAWIAAATGLITAAAPPSSDAQPARVSAGGITLVSPKVDLGADEATYPDAPHADVVNENCLACHSASMVLTQPRLSAAQWQAIVEKMRDVYKAPVPTSSIADIVAYLATTSARLPTESTAGAAAATAPGSPQHSPAPPR